MNIMNQKELEDKCLYKRECENHRPSCDFMNYKNCKHYQTKQQERNKFGYPNLENLSDKKSL